MHTIQYEDNKTGHTWSIHHNGDFSGEILFIVSEELEDEYGELVIKREVFNGAHYEIRLPFEMLKEIVGQYYNDKLIEKIEDMSGAETLDYIAK